MWSGELPGSGKHGRKGYLGIGAVGITLKVPILIVIKYVGQWEKMYFNFCL